MQHHPASSRGRQFAIKIACTIRQHPLAWLILSYAIFYLCQSLIEQKSYSSSLQSNSLGLSDLPYDYVKALDKSIHDGSLPSYNYTRGQIPRIIHRTFKTAEIPGQWQSAYDSCRAINPDYTHYLWTDATSREFIKVNFGWFLPTFDGYRYPIQRVDALRYFLLWHFGGVYMDLDISCRRPLDPLLEFDAWIPKTQPYGISNDLMASIPNHPVFIMLAMSLQSHDRQVLTGYTTVFWSTGPMFVNQILAAWFRTQDRKTTSSASSTETATTMQAGTSPKPDVHYNLSILPPMFYDRTFYTFFGHRSGSSWHGTDVLVAKKVWSHIWLVLGFNFGISSGVLSFIIHRRRKYTYLRYQVV